MKNRKKQIIASIMHHNACEPLVSASGETSFSKLDRAGFYAYRESDDSVKLISIHRINRFRNHHRLNFGQYFTGRVLQSQEHHNATGRFPDKTIGFSKFLMSTLEILIHAKINGIERFDSISIHYLQFGYHEKPRSRNWPVKNNHGGKIYLNNCAITVYALVELQKSFNVEFSNCYLDCHIETALAKEFYGDEWPNYVYRELPINSAKIIKVTRDLFDPLSIWVIDDKYIKVGCTVLTLEEVQNTKFTHFPPLSATRYREIREEYLPQVIKLIEQ